MDRFLIMHLGLSKLWYHGGARNASAGSPAGSSRTSSNDSIDRNSCSPTGCCNVDDNTGDEEIAEQILFFHSLSLSSTALGNGQDEAFRKGYARYGPQDEAVQFAGLCSTLYSLPEVLVRHPPSSEQADPTANKTKEVFLDSYVLIFQQLEASSDIIAVAQIARARLLRGANKNQQEEQRKTPLAFTRAIQLAHRLFCLLRGGGIHYRLSSYTDQWTDQSSESLRQGYRKLYSLRTIARRLRNDDESNRTNPKSSLSDGANAQRLVMIQEEIKELYEKLPLRSLRYDLHVHYEAFVGEVTETLADDENRDIFWSLGAMAPSAFEHRCNRLYPLMVVDTHAINHLSESLKLLSCEHSQSNTKIIGVISFLGGKQISSYSKLRDGQISMEDAAAILSYMSSLHWRSYSRKSGPLKVSSQLPKIQHRLPSISLSWKKVDIPSLKLSTEVRAIGFMSPPLLSSLSLLDNINAFDGPHGQVWLPPVSLGSYCLKVRACLYTTPYFTFLIFVNWVQDSDCEEGQMLNSYHALLCQFEDYVTRNIPWVLAAADDDFGKFANTTPSRIEIRRWTEIGQHIIYMSWKDNNMILYSDSSQQSKVGDGPKVWGIKFKPVLQPTGSNLISGPNLSRSASFTSNFNPPSLVPLQDAIEDIERRRQVDCSASRIEMCTFLNRQWVYAFSHGTEVVIVILDAYRFVTVAEVQQATSRIRQEFLALGG